jgi:hypothetical protein
MTSKTSNQSRPINFEVAPSNNETGFDFPFSPCEPGKFDFYRVHQAKHVHQTDSMFSDNFDAPTLSTQISSSGMTKRWTPFADQISSELLKSSTVANSASMGSFFPQSQSSATSSTDSSNPKPVIGKPIHSNASYSTLTDVVKQAMSKGHLGGFASESRRTHNGATLSTKDLNHLSPQSM